MTKENLVVANWKMNFGVDETIKYITEFNRCTLPEGVEVAICPPFTSLYTFSLALDEDSLIKLGAQNCHYKSNGAFTGEVSLETLKEMSCDYVIIGHSERRQYFNEDNAFLAKKIDKAFEVGVTPIYCVGETESQRESKQTFNVIQAQLNEGLKNINKDQASQMVIAYEPIWAIGTGKTATPDLAQEVHAFIRKWLGNTFGTSYCGMTRIIYGGSVKPDNAGILMQQPDINGSLVGGASLRPSDFVKIISASS